MSRIELLLFPVSLKVSIAPKPLYRPMPNTFLGLTTKPPRRLPAVFQRRHGPDGRHLRGRWLEAFMVLGLKYDKGSQDRQAKEKGLAPGSRTLPNGSKGT